MDNRPARGTNLFDQVAVGLSGLCVLHCLLLPFVLLAIPFLGQFGDDHFHVQVLLLVFPVSLIALGRGFRRHKNLLIILAGAVGLGVLAIGGTLVHSRYGLAADRVVTVAGSLILAAAHFANSRQSRRHRLAFSA